MGGEGVHIVETLLKIILSADLLPFLKLGSITNSHTNNPNSERGKSWSKTMEKQKKQKVSPHVTCPASPQTLSWVDAFCFFLFFLFVFSRFLQLCQSNNISCSFFLCFLFSCFLGFWENCSPWQISIGTAFTPPHVILMSSLSYWFWLLSHQRTSTVKTALSPTSSGTPLDWCFIGMPRFWFLMFKGLARVLQTWNH